MGSGGRLFNLWKGFTSIFVGDLEKKHPEIAYENAIQSLAEKHQQLKSAAASLLKNRKQLEIKLQRTEQDLKQITQEISTAIDLGDDQSALVLLEQQEALEKELMEVQADLDRSVTDAESAKASLRDLAEEIDKLKRERDRTLAQIKDSQARQRIQNQLDGFSMDDELKALDNVREYAAQVRAEVEINDELKSESLEGKLSKIREQSKSSRAQQRLEELKARRQKS